MKPRPTRSTLEFWLTRPGSVAGRCTGLTCPNDLLGELGVLNGYDIDLAADQTRIANRCRDNLVAISPALERAVGSRLHQPGIRDLLAKFPTPTALNQAGRTRIRATIKRRSPRLASKTTEAVLAALDAQTVTLPAETVTGRVIADLVIELGRVLDRRKALAAEIEAAFLSHPLGPVLNSLHGIGPRTGARILAEIGDASRFASGAKLASYAGLAPVNRQSGSSLDAASKSRRGNHRLKNAMFLAAFRVRSRAPTVEPFTTANEPKARNTTPPSSASPADAATSSTPCSPPTKPTNSAHPDPYKEPLDKTMGTPPRDLNPEPADYEGLDNRPRTPVQSGKC